MTLLNCHTDRAEPLLGCGIAGILSACVGIDNVLPIIHGPVGCAAGHRIVPLFAGKEPLVATTALTEIDVIMGTENRLHQAIERGIAIYHPAAVVVILTCATSLTGEIHSGLAESVFARHHVPCFVVDGSGVTGDEVGGYRRFWEAFTRWEASRQGLSNAADAVELAGLSTAHFEGRQQSAALRKLLKEALDIEVGRVLFEDLNLANLAQRPFLSLPVGSLWLEAPQPAPAPIGPAGIRRWLETVAALTHQQPNPAFLARLDALEARVERLRSSGVKERLRVGIECGSWIGLGLARFWAEELGCDTLLSSDAGAQHYQQQAGQLVETWIDLGGLELSDRMQEFGANLVFGSSYSRTDHWAWVPIFQPVWHVVAEQGSPMGLEGTERLLSLIEGMLNGEH